MLNGLETDIYVKDHPDTLRRIHFLLLRKRLKDAIQDQNIESFNELMNHPEIHRVVASDNNTALLRFAVYKGNLDMVKRLLAFQEVIQKLRETAGEIICEATLYRKLHILKYLLHFSVFCDKVAADINHYLLHAVTNSDLDMVNFLLEFTAEDNEVAHFQNKLLNSVVSRRNIVMLNRLLACPEVQAELMVSGNHTLKLAAQVGCVEILEELLKVPALRRILAAKTNDVLCTVERYNHTQAFNHLLEYQEVRVSLAVDCKVVLHKAATHGRINMVLRLVHFCGESTLQDLAKNFPNVYAQVINERLAIACSALLLNRLGSTDSHRLPRDIQHKVLAFLAHENACGQHNKLIEQRAGAGETRCKETSKFILDALDERETQNKGIVKKLRRFFKCC